MSRATALSMSLRTSVVMLSFTLVFTGLMAAVYDATKAPIAASAKEEKMKLVNEVLPPSDYDNDLLKDFAEIGTPAELGLKEPGRVYRARKGGEAVALVMEAVAPDGYSGDVGILLAIRHDGRVIAIRVTAQKETPGLGDYVDIHKDKKKANPWVAQFNGLGFGEVPFDTWKVKKDGGHFAYRTGATISARAVTNASGRALQFFETHKEKLFQLPAGAQL